MLLDRKRIRKWAKWVALLLAVVFVLSFLLLGVGYGGGAGFNIFDLFNKNGTTNTTLSSDAKIKALLATLQQNPKDMNTLQALASAYEANNDYTDAAKYLEQAITVDPTEKDLYLGLANLYENNLNDYTSAVTLLNKAASQFPNDPDVYLALGLANRSAGNTSAAIMAWQKYLSLAPNGDQAQNIKQAIAELAAQATTTSSAATTTTSATSTSSAAASTSSTAGTTTSSTAAPTTTGTT